MSSDNPFFLICGPCVIEDEDVTMRIADRIKTITQRLGLPFTFKASYDKANRSSITSFRGPGMLDGLKILSRIKEKLDVPVLSDVHRISEVDAAAQVLDVLQIPAFLCRQTDLLLAVAKTGKPVNVKKGQFMAPWDMTNVIDKIRSVTSVQPTITERGVMFGYNNLVVDFRGIRIMQQTGSPVIFDATHSVQLPGGLGKSSGDNVSSPRFLPGQLSQRVLTASFSKSTKIRTKLFAMGRIHFLWISCRPCFHNLLPLKPLSLPNIIL